MLSWGVSVGHGEKGDLQNGCAVDKDTLTDVAGVTIAPRELDRLLRSGNLTMTSMKISTTTSGGNGSGIPRILHQSYKSTLFAGSRSTVCTVLAHGVGQGT